MTQLFLNGYEVEIESQNVTQTIQANVLGEVKDRQLNYTNVFRILLTPRNNEFFGHLKSLQNNSSKPFEIMSAKLLEDGIEIMSEGSAYIKYSDENYAEVNIYSGINGIFDKIGAKSIRTLDFSSINHIANIDLVLNSFTDNEPYIYGIFGSAGLLPVSNNTTVEYMLPSLYEYYIFNKIFEEAGYTYSEESGFFESEEFKSVLVCPVTQDKGQNDLKVKDFSKMLPDITRAQFLKEIFVRYGLMLKKIRGRNHYEFKRMADVLKDRSGAINYTKQYAGNKGFQYVLESYKEVNNFSYKSSNDDTTDQDGAIEVEAARLRGSGSVFTSVYQATPKFSQPFEYIENQIFELPEDEEDELEIKTLSPWIGRAVFLNETYQFRDLSGNTSFYNNPVPILRFKDLSFRRSIYLHYQELRKIIREARISNLVLNLSPLDIFKFDPFKLIYLEHYGAVFYVNKISSFKKGKLTNVEGVKIPLSVYLETAESLPPTVNLSANTYSPTGDETVIFSVEVFNNPEDIDNWRFYFSESSADYVEGVGNPPATFTKIYSSDGSRTAKIEITDFNGNTSESEVQIVVGGQSLTSYDSSIGAYYAPPGATISINLSINGTGSAQSEAYIDTLPNGGGDDLAVVQACFNTNNCVSDPNRNFVMPASGVVYATGTHYIGESNINTNGSTLLFSYQGETQSDSFNLNNPLP